MSASPPDGDTNLGIRKLDTVYRETNSSTQHPHPLPPETNPLPHPPYPLTLPPHPTENPPHPPNPPPVRGSSWRKPAPPPTHPSPQPGINSRSPTNKLVLSPPSSQYHPSAIPAMHAVSSSYYPFAITPRISLPCQRTSENPAISPVPFRISTSHYQPPTGILHR